MISIRPDVMNLWFLFEAMIFAKNRLRPCGERKKFEIGVSLHDTFMDVTRCYDGNNNLSDYIWAVNVQAIHYGCNICSWSSSIDTLIGLAASRVEIINFTIYSSHKFINFFSLSLYQVFVSYSVELKWINKYKNYNFFLQSRS